MRARVKLSELMKPVSGVNKQGKQYTYQEMIFVVCRDDGMETNDKLLVTCRDVMYIGNPGFTVGMHGLLTYYSNVDEFTKADGTTVHSQRNNFHSWYTLGASISANIAQAAEEKRQEAVASEPDKSDLPF